jgi:hypothetical protein
VLEELRSCGSGFERRKCGRHHHAEHELFTDGLPPREQAWPPRVAPTLTEDLQKIEGGRIASDATFQ